VLKHYVLLALRNLRKAPVSAAANVLTLALGLVAFVTAYVFTSFWSSAEQGFARSERIAVLAVDLTVPDLITFHDDVSETPEPAARYLDAEFPALEQVAQAYLIDSEAALASGDRSVRSSIVAVDPQFLEIFDLPFTAGDSLAALRAPRSAVITQRQAEELFGGADPMGRTVRVQDAVEATITGVIGEIPEPSHFGRSAAALLQFDLLVSRDVLETIRAAKRDPDAPPPPDNWFDSGWLTYLLLPADGSFTLDALRAELPSFTDRHIPAEMAGFATIEFGALPVRSLLAKEVDGELFFATRGVTVGGVLLALGTLVLVVACINYANLATARAARRLRETGVRRAIGAPPAQIVLQHLVEAGVLAFLALGVALAALAALQPVIDSLGGAPLTALVTGSPRFWLAAIALALAVAFAAGAYPALALARARPMAAIRGSSSLLGPRIVSTLLVGGQFAVASFLLIAVVVVTLQNRALLRTGFGADRDPLMLIHNEPETTKVDGATLRAELERLPQVRGVTEMGDVPWEVIGGTAVATTPGQDAITHGALNHVVGYDFFSVFEIPLVAGRAFDRERFATDFPDFGRAQATPQPRAIVADRKLVAALGFASPESAIGELVYFPERTMAAFGLEAQPLRIIGVAENRSFSFLGSNGVSGTMYQLQPGLDLLVARVARDDVSGAVAAIDAEWRRLAPNVEIDRRFMDEVFDRSFATFARAGNVVAGLAAIAFLICVSGLFALASLVTARRRREIGVRKTLGASTRRMVAMLLASFGRPVVVANLIAWPAAYIAARSYLDLLLDPIELNWLPFAASLAATVAVAALAVAGQAVRAARTRPADVLRSD
jgi:putative ABC transport system permease protein